MHTAECWTVREHKPGTVSEHNGDQYTISTVSGRFIAAVKTQRDETEANARLIAAAPDMHDALALILFAVTTDADTNGGAVDRHAIAQTARKALEAALSA